MRNLFILVLTLLPFFAQATNPIDTTSLKTPWAVSDTIFSRQGFTLSVGLGGGAIQQKIAFSGEQTESENYLSFVGDITIGYGLTEQFSILATHKGSFYSFEDEDEAEESMKTSFNFRGIGGSYFFKPTAQSSFVSAGIGVASQVIDLDNNLGMNGLGLFAGAGYCINKNILIKAEVTWGNPGIKIENERLSINTLAVGVSANYNF